MGLAPVCSILVLACAAVMRGQSALADVNEQTPPERVQELLWDTIFTKCGGSYYYTEYRAQRLTEANKVLTVVEYREPHAPTLEPVPLSPADKANGFQYQGITTLAAAIWRTNRDPSFSDVAKFKLRMTKKNGKWRFEELNAGYPQYHEGGTGFWTDLDITDYTRGKLSCDVAFKAFPEQKELAPQVTGYVCPGTVLHGGAGIQDIELKKALKVTIVEKLGDHQEILAVKLVDGDDNPNRLQYRIYSTEFQTTSCPSNASPPNLGASTAPSVTTRLFVCPGRSGASLRLTGSSVVEGSRGRSRVIAAPSKISRVITYPDIKNAKAVKMLIQFEGDDTTYEVLQEQANQVKDSCAR